MKWNMLRCLYRKDDKSTFNQYLVVAAANFTIFTAGMHLGWSAPSVMKITSKEYPFRITSEEASYIVIIGSVGHIFGGYFASTLQDIIGRKNTLVSIGIPQIIAYALIYFSDYSVVLLYIARILSGIGEGANIALIPTYVAEVSEPKVRGCLTYFITAVYFTGTLFMNIVGTFLNIHHAALVCVIFPIMFVIIFSNMPESPYYLLMKKDEEGTREALRMLRRNQHVEEELFQLSVDVNRQMTETGTYKDLFTIRTNLRAFVLATGARMFQHFTGYSAFFMYSQKLIIQATNLSSVMGSSCIYITEIVVTFLSGFLVDRYGRKILATWSASLCGVSLLACAIFFTIRDYQVDMTGFEWLPLLFLMLYVLSFAGGLSAVITIFVGEIYSTNIKAKAMAIGSAIYALCQIFSTKFYQYTAENSGLTLPFYVFATFCLGAALFFAFVLPETKGKTLEQIQQELKGNSNKASIDKQFDHRS